MQIVSECWPSWFECKDGLAWLLNLNDKWNSPKAWYADIFTTCDIVKYIVLLKNNFMWRTVSAQKKNDSVFVHSTGSKYMYCPDFERDLWFLPCRHETNVSVCVQGGGGLKNQMWHEVYYSDFWIFCVYIVLHLKFMKFKQPWKDWHLNHVGMSACVGLR